MNKISRNDPCPCGSGGKYKKCCLAKAEAQSSSDQSAQRASHNLTATDAYRKTTKPDTGLFKAYFDQGNALKDQGKFDAAAESYREAIALKPDYAEAYANLGSVLYEQGKLVEAVENFRKALALNPSLAQAHYNLGNALYAQDKLDAAIDSYRKALSLRPDSAEVHNNLGVVLRKQGKLEDAVDNYRKALSLKPDFADAHYNLGKVFHDQGKLAEAVACYHKVLMLNPDAADAYNSLGNVFEDQGKIDEAGASYRRVLLLKPDYAEAHYNLGNTLKDQDKLEEAVTCYRQALMLKPDYAEAHCNLGNVLKDQDKLDAAIKSFRRAFSIKPDYAIAYNNMGNALRDQGKPDEAVYHYRQALSIDPDFDMTYSNLLFLYAYQALLDPHEYLAQARSWELACLTAQDRQAARDRIFQHPPLAGRRLKVGYVSADYRHHPVSFNIEQVFAQHDRARVELFAYSNHVQRDAVTERLQSLVEHWIPIVGARDDATRDRIEADGIDVLIDLSGHTAHNRMGVFALRAAPVQVYYLGYFASTGLTEMDYLIGDDVLTPPATDSHFSEQVWRLPRIWQVYNGKADLPVPGWRPDQGGTVWLGSFNNLNKLTPATLALWAKLLHALPEGKLLLKAKELADVENRRRILDVMSGYGIPPDRIEFQDWSVTPDWPSHMAYYGRLDIALDPAGGMGGGITTCDALWMGAPVITLEGDRYASRVTTTILDAIGHPEWIARSEAEYVDKVVALARDVEQRKALRATQRERMACSPLCDARDLAACLENAYFEMFERWQERKNGRPPL